MLTIIMSAFIAYVILTGIALFLAVDCGTFHTYHTFKNIRMITGIMLIGWIISILWMLFQIGAGILMLICKIFGFDI